MAKSTKTDDRPDNILARIAKQGPVHLEVVGPCETCGHVASHTKCGAPIVGSVMASKGLSRTIGTALTDIPGDVSCEKCKA